ncbi:MAG: acyltransferase [Pirellulales bacterium]
MFPPYWIAIAASFVLVALGESLVPGIYDDDVHPIPLPWNISPGHWFGNLTLTATWLGKFWGEGADFKNIFLGHAWTLCYEEQFYALVGLTLLAARRRFGLVVALVTVAVAIRFYVFPSPADDGLFYNGAWLQFAAGLGIYYDRHGTGRTARWAIRAALCAGLAVSCRNVGEFWERPKGQNVSFAAAYAFALVAIALHRYDARIARIRVLRPLIACGTMCYAIYLMHWVVVKPIQHGFALAGWTDAASVGFVVVPCALAASIVVGRLFHLTVEHRFLNTTASTGEAHPEVRLLQNPLERTLEERRSAA